MMIMMMMTMKHLFEIAVEQVTVLVKKPVHVIRHWSGVVYEAELLTHTTKYVIHRQQQQQVFINFTLSVSISLAFIKPH